MEYMENYQVAFASRPLQYWHNSIYFQTVALGKHPVILVCACHRTCHRTREPEKVQT